MTYVSPVSVELAAPESVGIDPRRPAVPRPGPARSRRRREDLRRQRRGGQRWPVLHGERRDRRALDPAHRLGGHVGNGGAPCQLGFTDPEAGTSFAFLTNGYPLAGYDYSARGRNLRINIGNLGNDLIG